MSFEAKLSNEIMARYIYFYGNEPKLEALHKALQKAKTGKRILLEQRDKRQGSPGRSFWTNKTRASAPRVACRIGGCIGTYV